MSVIFMRATCAGIPVATRITVVNNPLSSDVTVTASTWLFVLSGSTNWNGPRTFSMRNWWPA
jgi:hypothetical protein